MAITVWNPFREMDDILNRMQKAYPRTAEAGALQAWAPAVDISETAQEYLVKAELPGVNKDDVKLAVENGVLTLSGERKSEKETKEAKQHRIERFFGSFERSFSLPDNTQVEKIAADYKDGVLTVHIPKAEAKKVTKVEVQVQ
jgi:HSP20 family protein